MVQAPLMHELEEIPYYEDPLLKAVALPYGNSNLVMVVLLPKATNGVAQLRRGFPTPRGTGGGAEAA